MDVPPDNIAAWYETKKPAAPVVVTAPIAAAISPAAIDEEIAPDAIVPGAQP